MISIKYSPKISFILNRNYKKLFSAVDLYNKNHPGFIWIVPTIEKLEKITNNLLEKQYE